MTTYTCTLEIEFDKAYDMPEQIKKTVENWIDEIFNEMEVELMFGNTFKDDYLDVKLRASNLYKEAVYIPPEFNK
jgi:predicted RNA-binding protein Jag